MPRIAMLDRELSQLLLDEDMHYLGVIDLIAASNAPPAHVRDNSEWGVAQFRSAEGYPGRRPYAGTSLFDRIEALAAERARRVFRADYANVQPLSGSLANLAAYRTVLRPGDTLLSLDLGSGGHLSHGHPGHLVSDLYNVVTYGIDLSTGLIDVASVDDLARRHRPRAIIAGATNYPRAIDYARFTEIASAVGATLIADVSHVAGLIVAGLHANPSDVGAVVTTSVEKTLRGTRGGLILGPAAMADAIDAAVFPGIQSSIGLAGLVSLCLALEEAATSQFRVYQETVLRLARLLGEALVQQGIPLLSGGTDTHMLMLDVGALGLTGQEAESRLDAIGILTNRVSLPGETGPEQTGLRLGMPTIASRGFTDRDVREVADIVAWVLRSGSPDSLARTRVRVSDLAWQEREGDSLADVRRRRPRAKSPAAPG